MKIAILTKDDRRNGGNRVAAGLAAALARIGHQTTIGTRGDCPNLSWAGRGFRSVPSRYLFDSQHDLVISTYFTELEPLFRIPAKRRIKYIQANYTKDGEESAKRIGCSLAYLESPVAENVVVSHYLKEKLTSVGLASRVVHPTIDQDLFYYDPELDDGVFRVLVEGSRSRWKGVEQALEAIPPGIETWTLSAEDLGLPSDRAWVDPDQSVLRKIYSASAVLLKMSTKEGYPLSILEGMKCGAIPIVTPDGGQRDYCINGVNAFVVSDADEASTTLTGLASQPNLRQGAMGQAAVATASVRQWDSVVHELLDG